MKRIIKNIIKHSLGNTYGGGVSVLIFCTTIILSMILFFGRLGYNYYLDESKQNLTYALRNATSSALTQIDYTSAEGLFGLSNGGDSTLIDQALGLRKSLKLDEPKAIKAFYYTLRNNVKRYSYVSTLNKDIFNSIDKIVIIYPIYGITSNGSVKLYETYIFTPKPNASTPTTLNIASGTSALPGTLTDHSDRNKVLSYNDFFNVVAFEHTATTGDGYTYDEWFTSLHDLQTALNKKAGTAGYGNMQIFFSGSEEEYKQFAYNKTDTTGLLDVPLSVINDSIDPIFIGVIKNYNPIQIYGESNSDGSNVNLTGNGLYDVNISHIVRK